MTSPQRFVPRPVEVEAVQVTAENAAEVAEWAHWTDPVGKAPWRREGNIALGHWVVITQRPSAFTLSDAEFRRRYQPADIDRVAHDRYNASLIAIGEDAGLHCACPCHQPAEEA